MPVLQRVLRLLAAVWLGGMLCVALLATPAAFALLERADAGRLAARMLAQEAYASLALAVLLLVLQRLRARLSGLEGMRLDGNVLLTLGTVFCTVAGYFALLPLMAEARAGRGALSFGQLHAVSSVFYAVKVALVAALAWRSAGPGAAPAA